MLFPNEYPYKLRSVARRTKGQKTYYTNSTGKQMVCKQLVKDSRLIVLLDHYFAVTAKIKQTRHQEKEMQKILDESAEYADVFCLTQVQVNVTRFKNKVFILSKEQRKVLALIRQINFCFFKLFTAEALCTVQERVDYLS